MSPPPNPDPFSRLGDRSFVGSCSHDKTVRFWNVTDIYDKMRAEEVRAGAGRAGRALARGVVSSRQAKPPFPCVRSPPAESPE